MIFQFILMFICLNFIIIFFILNFYVIFRYFEVFFHEIYWCPIRFVISYWKHEFETLIYNVCQEYDNNHIIEPFLTVWQFIISNAYLTQHISWSHLTNAFST
jgi:hypothetical protein